MMRRQISIYALSLLSWAAPLLHATGAAPLYIGQQAKKTTFRITVLKSTRDPQVGMILRLGGEIKDYVSDAQGVIAVEADVESYPRTATLYFPTDKDKVVYTLTLNKDDKEPVIYLDSPEDILRFKQSQSLFPISGLITDAKGPVGGATIAIRGTGRSTKSDKEGKFTIEADYNHAIVVRAEGRDNLTLDIKRFLEHTAGPYPIHLQPKSSDRIYASVSRMPEFAGGRKALMDYIDTHLQYPPKARSEKKEGVVIVQFVVEKDGSLTSPAVVRPLEAEMDAAALRVVEQMPHWTPGEDDGIVVRCKTSIPILFKLEKPKPKPARQAAAPPHHQAEEDSVRIKPKEMHRLRTDTLKTLQLRPDSMRVDSVSRIITAPVAKDTKQAE